MTATGPEPGADVDRLNEISLAGAYSLRWSQEAARLLREVGLYQNERRPSHRGWYTGAELCILDVLEEKGMIERRPGTAKDGHYRLTAKGGELLDQLNLDRARRWTGQK